ncbi:hypothetical protein LZ554_008683 [Drepanopeziza brunnea f. sp. 'monogermtubi']|nr:hypothetical protein LZ554_008683 [Drepanopeziza brunnea f. sp. 'monogermtubi']
MPTVHHASPIRIEPITNPDDFARCFSIAASAFGTQTADGIWTAFNPGWDTPEGQVSGAARLRCRWAGTTVDHAGNANTVFLKATIPGADDESASGSAAGADGSGSGGEVIAGMAIWVQLSTVEGHGIVRRADQDVVEKSELAALYPNDQSAQDFSWQAMKSLTKQRLGAVEDAAERDPPAIMVLDLCAVAPEFQRRGIAGELVKWGLEEARRRGGLEAVMEASTSGRTVYARLGFTQEGPEIVLDGSFPDRVMPSNVFMRTGRYGVERRER